MADGPSRARGTADGKQQRTLAAAAVRDAVPLRPKRPLPNFGDADDDRPLSVRAGKQKVGGGSALQAAREARRPPAPGPGDARFDDSDDDVAADAAADAAALASAPYVSEREREAAQMTRRCRKGSNGVPGILAKRDANGDELLPYEHQWRGVKQCFRRNVMLLKYAMGLGKTAIAFLLLAAKEQCTVDHNGKHVGGCKMLCIVLPNVLQQWYDTAHCWLKTRGEARTVNPNEIKVFATTSSLTAEAIASARVLITTPFIVSLEFKKCFEYVERGVQDEDNRWRSIWRRKPGTPLQPLFGRELFSNATGACSVEPYLDVLVVDEVDILRNPGANRTAACAQLAKAAKSRVGMTATPIHNSPLDMAGICKGLGAPDHFCQKSSWFGKNGHGSLNMVTNNQFKEYSDRVDDTAVKLPPLTAEFIDYNLDLPRTVRVPTLALGEGESPDRRLLDRFGELVDGAIEIDVPAMYEGLRSDAEKLKIEVSREDNKHRNAQLQQLLSKIVKMMQMPVAPLLAVYPAPVVHDHPELVDACAAAETGALRELRRQIQRHQADGRIRVIVASTFTTILRVARRYIETTAPEVGQCFTYDGQLRSLSKREEMKRDFLTAPAPGAVLFLSIAAGGQGVHLVRPSPHGCTAIIFFEGRCYTPAAEEQCWKRIHRIGQLEPCVRTHLVASGSVGYAIGRIHEDKAALAKTVNDGEQVSGDEGGQLNWRQAGRIIDSCWRMNETGRLVPPPPPPPPPPRPPPPSLLAPRPQASLPIGPGPSQTPGRRYIPPRPRARPTPALPLGPGPGSGAGRSGLFARAATLTKPVLSVAVDYATAAADAFAGGLAPVAEDA